MLWCCCFVVLTDRASDKAKSKAEQEMGDLGNKHVQDSFIRMVYEIKGIYFKTLHTLEGYQGAL